MWLIILPCPQDPWLYQPHRSVYAAQGDKDQRSGLIKSMIPRAGGLTISHFDFQTVENINGVESVAKSDVKQRGGRAEMQRVAGKKWVGPLVVNLDLPKNGLNRVASVFCTAILKMGWELELEVRACRQT